MSLILALLAATPYVECNPNLLNQTWSAGGMVWKCNGSAWVSYTADAGGVPVLQAGPFTVSCTNCSGGGSSGAVSIDGGGAAGTLGVNVNNFPGNLLTDGGVVNVGNFPAMWPNLQWVSVDGGVTAFVSNFPGNLLTDGGVVNVGNFPTQFPGTVAVDGGGAAGTLGVNVNNSVAVTGTFWPANLLADGGVVNVGNFPAMWPNQQWVSIDGGTTAAVTNWPTTQAVSLAASAITGSNPCINPTATVTGVSVATSGTASVQLVALNGSTRIYVCSLNVTGVSGTTPTFKLTYGTGTACAVGTTGVVGPWTTTANTNFVFTGPTFAVTPTGQALCYIQTGTSPVSNVNLTYVQQ